MSKKIKKVTTVMFVIICFVLSLIGCGKESSLNKESSNKDTNNPLVLKLEGGDWGEPTPFKHYPRGPGIYKMRLIFDSLLEKDENEIIPWLAESWDIQDSGKTYIFKLRDGVKWQDGNKMTAEDVKFSFEYFQKNPPVSNDLLINNEGFIENIEILDGNKIKFKVKEPNATLLERIGDVRIIPKHIWEKVEDPKKFTGKDAVIGCGPYKLKEYNKELGSYKFEAFEDYWGSKPRAKELDFIPVSDTTLAFEQGDIDLTSAASDILSRYENKEEFKIVKAPAFWGYRMIFNMEKKAEFADKNIRQAIGYGININELIEKVARGAAVPASAGYLPIDHIWYNKDVKKYDFNIDKAKELLGDKKISFNLLVGNSKDEVRIGELIKLSLEKAGINVNVKSVDMKTRDAAVKKKNYEVAIIGHGGWGQNPDSLRTIYSSMKASDLVPTSDSIPGYSNDKINELCKKQMLEMDAEKRKQIIFELQEIISEELPMLPLYNTTEYTVYRPKVYDGWMNMFDHHCLTHSKLSYLERN